MLCSLLVHQLAYTPFAHTLYLCSVADWFTCMSLGVTARKKRIKICHPTQVPREWVWQIRNYLFCVHINLLTVVLCFRFRGDNFYSTWKWTPPWKSWFQDNQIILGDLKSSCNHMWWYYVLYDNYGYCNAHFLRWNNVIYCPYFSKFLFNLVLSLSHSLNLVSLHFNLYYRAYSCDFVR